MFSGPPLPLPPDLPLSELLAHAGPGAPLGAWIRSAPRLRIYQVPPSRLRVLASPDLGFLLSHCQRVLIREGHRIVDLAAETVIQWRALQVAMATPYLPGLERLRALFPGLQSHASGVLVPLLGQSAEEVLAGCVAEGLHVSGSRIVYVGEGGR